MENTQPKITVEDILAQLHRDTAEHLLKQIQSGEELSPQMLSAIIKFLKDNDITVVPQASDPLKEVAELLPFPSVDSDGEVLIESKKEKENE
tara:strand:- start:33930 stop:34205 length:276 start_codon:yes stop_codon:yes gene_type:complete